LLSLLQQYEASDPNLYVNELHSHLGVELSDLGDPQLEQHYRKYFHDRQQVVALAERSQDTLNQLEAQAKQLQPEIERLETSLKEEANLIGQISNELKTRAQNLDGMQSDLMNLKQQAEQSISQGDLSLVFEFEQAQSFYNAEVNDYNRQVQENQDRVARFNRQVESYEQKIDAYNQLVQTERSILSTLEIDRSVDALPEVSP
jgi:phage shock protein A